MPLWYSAFVLTSILALILGVKHATGVIQPSGDGNPYYDADFLGPACSYEELHDKEFDFIVYGATGSVGQAVVSYLIEYYPDQYRWAIAGRNEKKLNSIFSQFRGGANITRKSIVSPLYDVAKIQQLTKRAKVVLNCAGPYKDSGSEELIRAAVGSCTHYVDVSGELTWGRQILNKYHKAAKFRGVAIVQDAGFQSTAADLLAMSVANDVFGRKGKVPQEVLVVWTKMNGLKTFGEFASAKAALNTYGAVIDPYILVPNAPESLKGDVEMDGLSSWRGKGRFRGGLDERLWINLIGGPMAPGDCAVIRRSMALKFKENLPKKMVVREATTDKLSQSHEAYKFGLLRRDPAARDHMAHPFPNNLPAKWLREAGSTAAFAVAFEPGPVLGSTVLSTMVSMEQHGDPSTVATPVMAAEMVMFLATTGSTNGGGYLTPTMACPDIESRLKRAKGGNLLSLFYERSPTRSTIHDVIFDVNAKKIRPTTQP